MRTIGLMYVFVVRGGTAVELHIHVQKANDRRKCRHTELLTEELWTHIPKVQDGSLKRNLEVKNIHVHKCVI